MAYSNQDYSIVLPQNFPSIGETIQNVQARKERQQQRAETLSEKQREFDERNALAKAEKERTNRLFNLKQIQEATEEKKYETPYQKVNNAISNELDNIYKEGLDHVGEDPAFVSTFIRKKIQNAAQWYNMSINDSKIIQQQQEEFNKTFPNADLNKTTGILTNEFENNYFNKDAKGNILGIKEPHLIKQGGNYFEKFNDSNVLASVIKDTSPIYDFFRTIPKEPIEGSTYIGKRGNIVSKAYKGFTTPYSDEVTGDENKLEMSPKSQIVIDNNGESIRIADKSLKDAMIAKPSVEAAFDKLWVDRVKEKGLENINPHQLDILKEAYRYKFAEDQMSAIHQVNFKEKQIEPKPTIINMGNSLTFNDIAKQLDESLPKEGIAPMTSIPSEAREYLVKSVNVGRTVQLDSDMLGVVKGNDGTYRVLNMDSQDVVGVFSRKGINLKSAKGKYEREAIKTETQKTNSKKPTPKEAVITFINEGREYNIPSNQVEAFMKAKPKAKPKAKRK